jgi:2-dehydro-3-deoxyphosphogluconate aldolase/(4S)-4-hydroxy-2-oxoglutarate aldolase
MKITGNEGRLGLDILEELTKSRIVAIFRGDYQGKWGSFAKALLAGGIRILELTMNSPDVLSGFKEIQESFNEQILLGAGTVLTPQNALDAINAGARFIVAPDTDNDVIKVCLEHNIPMMPGASTPTEVKHAYKLGAEVVKLFPAQNAEYVKSIHAPLNHIPLMATGGVNIENAREYLNAGAIALGLGSSLVSPKLQLEEITARSRRLIDIISNSG